jgi:hypothetical protein
MTFMPRVIPYLTPISIRLLMFWICYENGASLKTNCVVQWVKEC